MIPGTATAVRAVVLGTGKVLWNCVSGDGVCAAARLEAVRDMFWAFIGIILPMLSNLPWPGRILRACLAADGKIMQ